MMTQTAGFLIRRTRRAPDVALASFQRAPCPSVGMAGAEASRSAAMLPTRLASRHPVRQRRVRAGYRHRHRRRVESADGGGACAAVEARRVGQVALGLCRSAVRVECSPLHIRGPLEALAPF